MPQPQARRKVAAVILVGLGSNQPGPWGTPAETVARALGCLGEPPLRLVAASALVVTAPYGRTDQPDFVNACARLTTRLGPAELLARLAAIERAAARDRRDKWGPRTLDLDLLDYDGRLIDEDAPDTGAKPLVLPHPGIAERAFVLAGIAEIAPRWRHPVLGRTAASLLADLGGRSEGAVKGRAEP